MDELILDSLRRRMRAMHSLYYDAVATMTVDHVNHVAGERVLPIAFSLFHYTNMEDATFMVLAGEAPIWGPEWQARVQMAIDDHGKERTVEEMMGQRVGDYDALCEYQRQVFGRTEAWLDTLEPDALTELLVPRPLPDVVANTYSARVAGPDGITRLDGIECWMYQHGLRHMGEIELNRGFVGLGGMTS